MTTIASTSLPLTSAPVAAAHPLLCICICDMIINLGMHYIHHYKFLQDQSEQIFVAPYVASESEASKLAGAHCTLMCIIFGVLWWSGVHDACMFDCCCQQRLLHVAWTVVTVFCTQRTWWWWWCNASQQLASEAHAQPRPALVPLAHPTRVKC